MGRSIGIHERTCSDAGNNECAALVTFGAVEGLIRGAKEFGGGTPMRGIDGHAA